MTTRRRFLAGAAAAAAIPASARAAERIVFATPFGFQATFIDIMNAYSGGHFAAQGLDCKVVGPPGTSESFQLMLAGEAQFALVASIDFIRAVGAKGAPFTSLATIGQTSGFSLVSLADKPVRGGADLEGKTVGVLSVGGLTETMVDILLKQAGLPKSAARIVVAGHSPAEVELIRQGRIDCFVCNFPVAFALRRMKAPVFFLDLDKAEPAPGQLYYATRDTIARRPELVRKVLRAMKASVLEIMAGPTAPIFGRAARDFDIPRIKDIDTLVAMQKEVIAESWLALGRANLLRNVPALWQTACDALRKVEVADVKNPATLYDNRFIDAVMKG